MNAPSPPVDGGPSPPRSLSEPWRWFAPFGGWGRLAGPAPKASAIGSLARPRRLARGGRAFAFWVGAFYALSQFVVGSIMDHWHPTPFETIWRLKWARIREMAANGQNRPLLVMLGSSRTDAAFQAGRLNGLPGPDGRPLLAYNLGVPAAGPMHEWLYLRELLDAGIRPRLLLVEYLPPLLNGPGRALVSEEGWTEAPWLTVSQLSRLWPYFTRPRRKGYRWLEARLAPAYAFRPDLHFQLQVKLEPEKAPRDFAPLQDEWGCRMQEVLTEQERAERLEAVRRQYALTLAFMRPGDGPCRALRDLLACCRREHIPVALVVMPEASVFRSWYSFPAEEEARRFLAELRREFGVEVIDGRCWVADKDFADGHHVLAGGADAFTTRLRAEVQRLLAEEQARHPSGPSSED